jgi:hypothetical protein
MQKHYAHLAGLVDGDGCIMAYVAQTEGQKWYRVHLSVNSVDKKVINHLVKMFGGSRNKRTRPHYKQGFIWEWKLILKQSVKNLLEQITPYLVIKKQQARLAAQFLDLQGRCPEDREALIREIQRLNQSSETQTNFDDIGKMKWPYLAGVMDAEGTFTVRKDFRGTYIHYGIWARLGNTNEHLINWLNTFFQVESIEDDKSYYWFLPHDRKGKEKFILAILPFLVTKKEQAKVLLDYIKMGDEKNPLKREQLYQKCFALNHPY